MEKKSTKKSTHPKKEEPEEQTRSEREIELERQLALHVNQANLKSNGVFRYELLSVLTRIGEQLHSVSRQIFEQNKLLAEKFPPTGSDTDQDPDEEESDAEDDDAEDTEDEDFEDDEE